jgi:hypothetical protein
MNSVRRISLLLVFLIGGPVAAHPQAGDPVAALNELLAADKITDATRHYPVAVEEAIRALRGEDKEEAVQILLMRHKPGGIVYKLRKPGDAGQGEAGDNRITHTVVNSFVSGNEGIIVTRINFSDGGGANRFFALRFEAGEWRLRSIGTWIEEENYDSERFIQELLPTGRNEIAAVETLGEINALLEVYGSSTDGMTEYPSSLSARIELTPPAPEIVEKPDVPEGEPEPDSETSNSAEPAANRPVPSKVQRGYLLDPVFMKDPAVKDGYIFHYKLIDPGTAGKHDGRYQITAIPVQFGKTGNKSYFMDQTAVIRCTTDNREANENDAPLNDVNGGQQVSFTQHQSIR